MATRVIQDGLDHPWDIAFAPDGRMLVTERIGRVLVFASAEAGAELLTTATIPDVRAELESGLMGIAVDGTTVYVCASRDPGGDGGAPWRVDLMRATLSGDGSLSAFEPMPIGETIGGPRHQGCAVEVAEGFLWLTIGDANMPDGQPLAQETDTLNGKVLRLELDGSIPDDNPFESAIYSLGHRNPQGLAIRSDGLIL
ncbi:MAG TPA: PQQ-dependent sugar dehydrogenase, partial [Candidatus Limnocylindria bacterium]|nr:PQQ-dependent sugar dehydrogenase [Candidatus Limnocylindria bacterium]